MNLSKFYLSLYGALLMLILLCSCSKPDKDLHSQDDQSLQLEIDSASYKYVQSFIKKEQQRVKHAKAYPKRITSFDTTMRDPVFVFEYFFDRDTLSSKDFFKKADNVNVKHFTKTMGRRISKTPEHNENTAVFNENGDEVKPQFDFVTKVHAFSSDYVAARIMDIDHVELYYSKHNVLYLSIGSYVTGYMSAHVYDSKTGEHITSYQEPNFDGSYYSGNGVINTLNYSDVENLEKTESIRVVIMIDDKFCFREFAIKDIIEKEQEATL